MAKTNLSLGNLYRAISGSARTTQAVSVGSLAGVGAGSNAAFTSFAIDSVTVTPPTYTYIVESTTETATFSFGSPGALHASKVGTVAANYSVTFDTANFTIGSATLGGTPSFPITANPVGSTVYAESSASLSMKYQDGYNINATNYNSTTTKLLYAVDVYNTINQPDFCLLFGTKIELANDSEINVEDLVVGDSIKAWVPDNLPDETQPLDSENIEWRFYLTQNNSGSAANVVVKDIVFNFASGYYDINNGLVKATGTHPLWVYDSEIQQYHFKQIENINVGDKLVSYNDTDGLVEVLVSSIESITEDVEIVTINVENADVFLSNGVVSHNKGTTTQPYIPSTGLRMYLDPSKASSTNGTATTDWLDLTGYGTGFRPAGVANSAGITGTNPAYNNGVSRKEKYWAIASSTDGWYKDRVTNINGGSTYFDTSAITYVTWFRLGSHFAADNNRASLFKKSGADFDYSVLLERVSSGVYKIYFNTSRGTPGQFTTSNQSLSTGVWYMVSATVSAANGANLYIDSSVANGGSTTISAFDATSSTHNMYIGNMNQQSSAYQQGPALFYNRVLSSTEIGQVYNYFSPSYK